MKMPSVRGTFVMIHQRMNHIIPSISCLKSLGAVPIKTPSQQESVTGSFLGLHDMVGWLFFPRVNINYYSGVDRFTVTPLDTVGCIRRHDPRMSGYMSRALVICEEVISRQMIARENVRMSVTDKHSTVTVCSLSLGRKGSPPFTCYSIVFWIWDELLK